jgi:cytochrome c oxidase subunit I
VAIIPIAMGRASILYTFYPPMIAHAAYYFGIVFVVVGSWMWVGLTSVNLRLWRRKNPGRTIAFPMFANTVRACLWAWTSLGAAIEVPALTLPAALGLTTTVNVALSRVLFSWTLHAIVYFWLIPSYIAYYTIVRARSAGGFTASRWLGSRSFCFLLSPCRSASITCLWTRRWGRDLSSCIRCSPPSSRCRHCSRYSRSARWWRSRAGFVVARAYSAADRVALAQSTDAGAGVSFIMLGLGGAGGLVNMSYQLNASIHNTQWVTGHFHLIFAGAIVIMHFAIAYDVWPHLIGRSLNSFVLMRAQLWT